MTDTLIRQATPGDHDAIWSALEPVVSAGEVFALPRSMSRADALAYWLAPTHDVFVIEAGREVVGCYYLRANGLGGGSHVANCGYITNPRHTGRGLARAMCAHSIERARERGFRAMQFNFVVASNQRAVTLWESMGFAIVGRLPGAFAHPTLGDVDALIMYRAL
jgi:ribosomal protein S18 acetylase RimI-like enzyme